MKIPTVWKNSLDNIVFDGHPIDIILDILLNHVGVRESRIDFTSFEVVKTISSTWKETRTITGNSEEAKTLLEELRLLVSCIFLIRADGIITIKRWNPEELFVAKLKRKQLQGYLPDSKQEDLINNLIVYFGWNGSGDKASDFSTSHQEKDDDSISNWRETKTVTIKNKWTLPENLWQVEDMASLLVNRYKNPPVFISGRLFIKYLFIETGDFVEIDDPDYPSVDGNGKVEKFQVVSRRVDFIKFMISFKFLRV